MEGRKSRGKMPRQILGVLAVGRAQNMLSEWVNTDLRYRRDVKQWERLFRRYPEIVSGFDDFNQQMEMGIFVAEYLRKGWDATLDPRRFEWFAWRGQDEYAQLLYKAKYKVPRWEPYEAALTEEAIRTKPILADSDGPPAEITQVEAAIFYLRQNRNVALRCPNPECLGPGPYFFRQRKGQKFCSTECALPSQRESKRQWWAKRQAKGRKA